MLRKVPLVVILGSTGTGKTKLSLELAERFSGEIISADSMQVYANLDIVTAKVTKEERSRAKHHLLDVATPNEPYTVVHFRNAALPIIENLLAQSKCPIVVGGTNYYIESLLWDILVNTEGPKELDGEADKKSPIADNENATASENAQIISSLSAQEMTAMSSESLHSHLRKIDPSSANRLHPNDKRKIMRAIEVYQETGQTLSSKLKAQREQPGGNRLGGPLRYPHTILFWLRCRQDLLNKRLDNRVDAMLEQGLLREIRAFYNEHKQENSTNSKKTTDLNTCTKGVLQTIGFKEFIPYLEQFNAENDEKIEEYLKRNGYKMPPKEQLKAQQSSINAKNDATKSAKKLELETGHETELPAGIAVLNACLNELKLVTQRYSKKQIKWINNRFLASKDRQVPDLYELDTSDVSKWKEAVYQRAVTIIDCYRNGQVCEVEPMAKRQHPGAGLDQETSNFCMICQRHFVGEFQWQVHLSSNKHKKCKESQSQKKQAEEGAKTPAE